VFEVGRSLAFILTQAAFVIGSLAMRHLYSTNMIKIKIQRSTAQLWSLHSTDCTTLGRSFWAQFSKPHTSFCIPWVAVDMLLSSTMILA
jgi:hypothetical protein